MSFYKYEANLRLGSRFIRSSNSEGLGFLDATVDKTLRRLQKIGYKGVVITFDVDLSNESWINSSRSSSLIQCPLSLMKYSRDICEEEGGVGEERVSFGHTHTHTHTRHIFSIKTRINLHVGTKEEYLQLLPHKKILQTYDIVSVTPTCQVVFDFICLHSRYVCMYVCV